MDADRRLFRGRDGVGPRLVLREVGGEGTGGGGWDPSEAGGGVWFGVWGWGNDAIGEYETNAGMTTYYTSLGRDGIRPGPV